MSSHAINGRSTSAVSLRGVGKRFGAVDAVRRLDLEVGRGQLVGLLGPNGAGKSTAIRMVMSLIRPDQGELQVLGGDALDMKDRIGYLPEERGVYRRMRVGEFLIYMGRLKGLPQLGLAKRVEQWLERIELPGVFRSRCQELSKGMQQKVQFISAVLHEPDLIVLDEPFSGLDPVNARVLIDAVRELHAQGRTIFLSTHQMAQAEQLCQRVVLINRLAEEVAADIMFSWNRLGDWDRRRTIREAARRRQVARRRGACVSHPSVARRAGHARIPRQNRSGPVFRLVATIPPLSDKPVVSRAANSALATCLFIRSVEWSLP